jgi:TonB-dependent receptor
MKLTVHTHSINLNKSKLSEAIHRIILGSVIAGVSMASVAADKTDTDDNDLEVIQVSGSYARSLEKAVGIKRSNIGFSDSVVATDIADFPDQNLAEALQRMPGVTIERNKGLGTKVNVRSLPTEFTHVSLNNLATASGSGGRDVEFDIFASEIIQSVSVKKSPTAADEEGGIAGNVSITTARPFDYHEGKLIVSAEAAHNSISEEIDPKFSILASEQYGDWGALVSFASSTRSNRTDSNSGIDFRPINRWLEKKGSDSKQAQSDQTAAVLERDVGITINDRFDRNETNRIAFINKAGDRVYDSKQDKWGATASIQYKPSYELSFTFDAMLGSFDTTENGYDAAAYSASSSSALEEVHAYDDTTLAEYGMIVLTDVSYANTQHEFLSLENTNKTDFTQYSLQLDWEVAGWDVNALVGYSGAEKSGEEVNLKHTAYGPTRTRFTATGGETIRSDNPNSFNMYTSPGAYKFDHYDVDLEDVSDDKYAAQLDFTKSLDLEFFPALARVEFGMRYTDKSKKRNFGNNRVKGPSEGDSSWSGTRIFEESELTSIDDLAPGGRYLSESDKNLSWSQVSNSYARDTFRYDGFRVNFEEDEFYEVEEEVISVYAMADFEFEVATLPVSLNTGIRMVDTSVLSSGYQQVQNDNGSIGYTPEPISREGDYNNILPSINIAVELTDEIVLRAAASETL